MKSRSSPYLTILLLAFSFVLYAPVHARAEDHTKLRIPPSTQLRLTGLGVAGGASGLAIAVGVGAGTWFIAGCPSRCEGNEGFAPFVASAALASLTAIALVPLGSALFVHRAARREGYRGRLGHTYLGALAGLGVGAAAGLGLALVLMPQGNSRLEPEEKRREDRRFLATTIAGGSVLGLASVGVFSMLAYRWSSYCAVTGCAKRYITPNLGPTVSHGWVAGASGRF